MKKKAINIPTKTTSPATMIRMGCVIMAMVLFSAWEMKYSSMARFSFKRHTLSDNGGQESKGPIVAQSDSSITKQQMWDPSSSWSPPPPAEAISCDRSHYFYDICSIHVPTVLDPTTSTFLVDDPNPTVKKIQPYPRKWENRSMSRIKEFTITTGQPIPRCHVMHRSPAVVFSAGGYTGNFFHDFSDGFIPLFITVNTIFHDQNDDRDVVLVISKARDWWIRKYANLLGKFSKHQIIDLDNDKSTHCFPSATLGLIAHGFLTIDQERMPNSKSLNHFHEFLSKAYMTNHPSILPLPRPSSKPRVVLVNRPPRHGRALLNLRGVKLELEKIGFEVIMFQPTHKIALQHSFALFNSSHAMVGVHGAALTHLLFLRPGAVFLQVMPLGTEWAADVSYGSPAKVMGLNYMEYKIRVEESSLIEKYGKEDRVIKDPVGFSKGKPWSSVMNIYLKEQNVRLDLVRFRKSLKEAYKKAKQFMDNDG